MLIGTVLVVLRIRRSMGTVRFALCTWGFADSVVNDHNSLCSLCLRICGSGIQWEQLAVLGDLQIQRSMGAARFARCACGSRNRRFIVLGDF